jgi:hypothetical protein
VSAHAEPAKKRPASDIALGVPIVGFTGVNGAGKTTMAVESAIADMATGRTVYSTVPITSPWGNSEPIVSLRQLLELEDATVLLDDIAVIFSSRSTQSLPPEVVAFLQTMRHKRITMRWTAPEWRRADNLVRGVTQALVNVRPMWQYRNGDSPWRSPRMIAAGLLDTTTGKVDETPTRIMRRRFYVPRRMLAWDCYDTHAPTPLLGVHLQGGRCVDCGGTVKVQPHSRERHDLLGLPWYGEDLRVPTVPSPRELHDHSGDEAGTSSTESGPEWGTLLHGPAVG